MDDILAAIDAATSQQLCACGCKRALDPNGPHQDFATQDCMKRWQNRQAHRPDEVYERPDAAPYPGDAGTARHTPNDHQQEASGPATIREAVDALDDVVRGMLNGTRPVAHRGDRGDLIEDVRALQRLLNARQRLRPEPPRRPASAELASHASGQLYIAHMLREGWLYANTTSPVPWVRRCRHCRDYTTPVDGVRARTPITVSIIDDPSPVAEPLDLDPCHICDRCHQPFPGPLMAALWKPVQRTMWNKRVRLVASQAGGGYRYVEHGVTDEFVHSVPPGYLWEELEREMLRALAPRCPIDGCDQPVGEGVTDPFTLRTSVQYAGQWWHPGEHHWCGRHQYELRRQLLDAPDYRIYPWF